MNKYILFLLVVFLYSCSSMDIKAPESVALQEKIEKKTSTIAIPISINVKELEESINKNFNGLIYENMKITSSQYNNLAVKAWKKSNISIGFNGNQISYRLPLKIWCNTSLSINKLGVNLSTNKDINGEIALKYKTNFTLNKDWTISTKTTADGYEWLSSPYINIFGVNVPISYIADIVLKSSQNMITKQIDDTIKSGINIKSYIEPVWQKLLQPFQLEKNHGIWLKVSPSEVFMTPVTNNANNIVFTIGINSVNEVKMGSAPENTYIPPLPLLNVVNYLKPYFNVNVNTEIPFEEINELAKQQIIGKTFKEGKKSITIKSFDSYASGDYLVCAVTTEGSLNGKIFLKGKPDYNPENNTIFIKELDFDINTKNALLKTANWLLHSKILKTIEPKLSYSIKKELDDSKLLIKKYLKENNDIKGLTINGELLNMDIDKIYITEKSLKVNIIFEGSVNININKF